MAVPINQTGSGTAVPYGIHPRGTTGPVRQVQLHASRSLARCRDTSARVVNCATVVSSNGLDTIVTDLDEWSAMQQAVTVDVQRDRSTSMKPVVGGGGGRQLPVVDRDCTWTQSTVRFL